MHFDVNQFLVIAINKPLSSRRGPRTFDRDQAIQIALRLFWRHGYEGVSIGDLTNAIGIAPPSLYAAFGSKAALYRETLDRYGGLPGAMSHLTSAATLTDTVERFLRSAVDAVTDPLGERGCMISTGMIQCAAAHAELAADLAARRRRMRDKIAKALSRWLDKEHAQSLSRYLMTMMQGLSIQARDGATRHDLNKIVDEVVAGLRARQLSERHSGRT